MPGKSRRGRGGRGGSGQKGRWNNGGYDNNRRGDGDNRRNSRRRDDSRVRSSQPRNDERRFFDAITKQGDTTIRSVEEAIRLTAAALAFATTEGAPALLYRLNEDAGSSALRKCCEYMDSSYFERGFLPLLERLAQEDLNKPVYEIPMNCVLLKLYQLPFLLPSIKSLACDWIPRGQNDKRTALAWFFAKISLENDEARKNEHVIAIAGELSKVGCGEHLQTILGGNKVQVSISHIRDTQMESAGGRHDNDLEDFRSISIVPTCQEFLSDADPYLPVPIDDEQATEAFVLDRHFRLLREDLIGPSKEEKDDPKKQQRDIFYDVRPIKIETGAAIYSERGGSRIRVAGETDPCIMFKLKLPTWFRVNSMSDKDKIDYWERNNRILPRDALICLERRSGQESHANTWQPVRFGTIARREVKDLVSKQASIGISFASKTDFEDTIKELSDKTIPSTRLVVVSADLFAYQPILRGLQMMAKIPFKEEIVHSKQSLPALDSPISVPDAMADRVGKLDSGQQHALSIALNDRVALIQGPPGTGKSFVGVLLTEIFLLSTDETILIVTFTNHALDDILEDLLNRGITNLVRIGGRSRSDRLSEYNLRELGRSGKAPFSREQTRRYAQLKTAIEEAEKDVKQLDRKLLREMGEKWWATVEPFLKDHHRESWVQ